jgi:hypothetical protein
LFCFAEEKINLKIDKHNNISALIEKETNKEVLPYKYNKIRKVKYDKKTIYIGEAVNYITLYSPDGMYDDFLENYYKSNKYNSKVQFKNYPKRAVIRYEQNKKYGLILAEKDRLHITKPLYEKIVFPDENSMAAKFLNISFAPEETVIAYYTYMKGKYAFQNFKQILDNNTDVFNFKILPEPAVVKENIVLGNGYLTAEYNGSEYFRGNFDASDINKVKYNTDLYTPADFYNIINSSGKYNFVNYPLNIMVKDGYHIYVYENMLKYEITVPCSDFYIETSVFNILNGTEISFFNSENIIAKNGSWGIINKNNEITVPFEYDVIYPLNKNYREEIYSKKEALNFKKTVKYISLPAGETLFLVKKGYAWGIINNKNDIIVPFETQKQYSENEITKLKAEISNKVSTDYKQNGKEKFNLPLFILDLLLLPIWILMPNYVGINAHIHY